MPPAESGFLNRNPVFKNFLWASNISQLGSYIFDISMPLYMIERTHSATALALVTVALTLPFFLMAPLTGYSADHLNKRRVMLASDVGQSLCMMFLLVYDVTGCAAIWPILLAVFVTKSFMISFDTVSTFQLIPALVPQEDLSSANTWFLSLQRIVQIVGPMLGGLAMSLSGMRLCTLLNLLSFGATLFFVFRLKNLNELIEGDREESHFLPMTARNILVDFAECLRYIWRSELFKPFIVFMFVWNLSALSPNTPSLTFYFTELRHLSSAQYGLVLSLFGVLGILGFLGSTSLYNRYEFSPTFIWSCFWQALLATLCLSFFRSPFLFAFIFACSRASGSVVTMGTFFLRQTQIPKSKIGGVNACIRMLFMSAAPISALFQAFLIDHFGVEVSLTLGALCLWGAFWYARSVGEAFRSRIEPPLFSQNQAA